MNVLARASTTDVPLPSLGKVVAFWKRNGLRSSSAIGYQRWVHRFISDYAQRGISPSSHLTEAEVRRFAMRYARRRQVNRRKSHRMARSSLRAWSVGLAAFGVQLPLWSAPKSIFHSLPPLLTQYTAFRHAHSNATDSSIDKEIREIAPWLRFLRSRRRKLRATRLRDVDAYLLRLRRHYALASVARRLSSLRLFFRFLQSTGRLRHDLASSIQCPPGRCIQPPRALPWSDVQRILQAVNRNTRTGSRDYLYAVRAEAAPE